MTAVLPLPIFQGVDKLTDVELGTPGQLILDTQGKLLREYLKYAGFTMPYRKAYDNWLQNILPLQIKTYVFNTKKGVITVISVSYRSPYNDNTTDKPIYPKQVRENEGTYELTIMVKYKYTPIINGKLQMEQAEVSKDTVFGKLPLMLGTKYCHLWDKTDAQLVALGECPCDPLGYFIIKGSEKLILLQEKVRVNKVIISFNKKEWDAVISSYTINTYKGPKRIMILADKFDEFQLHIVGLGKNLMNLFIAFRFLGVDNVELAVQMIKYFIPEKFHRKVDPLLLLTIGQSDKISDKYEYTAELINESRNVSREEKVAKIDNILNTNLYPNMNIHPTVGENNFIKATMLALQASHLVQYKLGIVKIDDRDNCANKRIESAGRLMEQLFTSLYTAYVTKIQGNLDAEGVGKEGLNTTFDKNYIGDNFEKAFGTESWGAPGTTHTENVTDMLKRESVNSTLAQLTRINTPTSNYSSSIEPRLVHPSQAGYICPVTSPEGERAGLIKSIAITCYPSIEKSDILLIQNLKEYKYNPSTGDQDSKGENLMVPVGSIRNDAYSFNHTPERSFLVMVNGIPRGWINAQTGYQYVRSFRRTGVYTELAIVQGSGYKILDIYTDGARPLRPLLIVDPLDGEVIALKNGYLEPSKMQELVKTGTFIEFLMQKGALEYIDAYEQDDNAYIAQTFAQIQKFNTDLQTMRDELDEAKIAIDQAGITNLNETKEDLPIDGNISEQTILKRNYNRLLDLVKKLEFRPRFTHCELDPTAILGQTASVIPMPGANMAPRNMFTQGMINQSLGIYHSNQDRRFDTGVKTLAYPTRPMFETQANDFIGTSEMPYGQTVKVAIMAWTGFNQEDGLIFNRQSIDNGLFTTVKYLTYKASTYSAGNQYTEKYKKPATRTPEMEHKFRNVGDNGFPLEGSYMEEGDVVISKVRIINGKEIFVGEVIGIGDEGVVHRVRIGKNALKNETGRVMIRQVRKPQIGDKFASRSAQKGTIGLILPPEDMPYISDGPDMGISPDIIINSHSLISRMTIGKMIEIVATKVGLIRGERMNATAFRPVDHKDLEVNLRQYGFNSQGNERMYSGLTGKLFPAEIFVGPCYYSSLGKDVKDKIQARSSASVEPSSHEPTRGRTNRSGQAIRVGTQENTSFVGHNAPGILRERLNDSSDGFRLPICQTCGNLAIHNVEFKTIKCKKCGTTGNFGQVTIPGSYKLITQTLYGMNINQTLGLSETYQKI